MKKILFLTLVLSIFLISMVSAYSSEEKLGITYTATSASSTKWAGEYINVTRLAGIEIVSFNTSVGSTANKCYVLDTSNNTLYSGTITSNNCTLATHPRLEYATVAVVFVNKTADWDRRQVTPVTYPRLGTYIKWVQGVFDATNYTNYAFEIDTIVINIPSLIENNVSIINQKYNSSSVETKIETFKINITANGTGTVTARFIYNGTDYGLGTSMGDNTNLQFVKTINVPLIAPQNQSIPFYWNITWNGITDALIVPTQFVNMFQFGLCNNTIKTKFMNLTFKDESTNAFINASLSSANFVYWLETQTSNKSYTLINNTNNYEYDFCSSTTDYSLTSKANIQYQSTDYPQRLFSDTLSLSNVSTNKTLYLLGSTDGIYVTFQLINGNTEQVLNGVNVIGARSIGGESTTIAIGTTDSAGSVTFWLNPDFEHTFNFSKSGYDTYTTTIYPTQTSYTISMTSGTTTTSIDYTKGISYQLSPSGGAKIASLMNLTTYNFTYSLASNYWDVSQFGFSLYYGNNSLVGSVSANTNGGNIGLMANTLDSSNMIMKYYYVINSTYYNGTRTWFVERGAYEFSILHFFEDLTLYMDNGMFGIDDLARVFFCLIIITMVTGGVIMRYGINNEAAIMGILFGLVYFLDIGVGLLPQVRFGNVAIEHFITIATALLLIGFLFKEESR